MNERPKGSNFRPTMKSSLPLFVSILPLVSCFYLPADRRRISSLKEGAVQLLCVYRPLLVFQLVSRSRNRLLQTRHCAHQINLQSTTNTEISVENDSMLMTNNPLQSAGLSFISASTKSLGMLFYNIGGMDHKEIQALLLEAGTQLLSAGSSWDSDWEVVRTSMSDASRTFYDISNVFGSANIDESLELAMLFELIGRELEDISSISGCCAIGPPSSCSNLMAVEDHLTKISKILKKNSVAATDEHIMCSLFKEVAELFGVMADNYIDESGQESEVSV